MDILDRYKFIYKRTDELLATPLGVEDTTRLLDIQMKALKEIERLSGKPIATREVSL